MFGEQVLKSVEIGADPQRLHKTGAPTDDLEQPVRAAPAQIPGAQHVRGTAIGEISRAVGIVQPEK